MIAVRTVQNFVDGKLQDSAGDGRITLINPATGEELAVLTSVD